MEQKTRRDREAIGQRECDDSGKSSQQAEKNGSAPDQSGCDTRQSHRQSFLGVGRQHQNCGNQAPTDTGVVKEVGQEIDEARGGDALRDVEQEIFMGIVHVDAAEKSPHP
jgi:hypothetical protein